MFFCVRCKCNKYYEVQSMLREKKNLQSEMYLPVPLLVFQLFSCQMLLSLQRPFFSNSGVADLSMLSVL
jgi:hypothetical protein